MQCFYGGASDTSAMLVVKLMNSWSVTSHSSWIVYLILAKFLYYCLYVEEPARCTFSGQHRMVTSISGWNSQQVVSLMSAEIWETRNKFSLHVNDLRDTVALWEIQDRPTDSTDRHVRRGSVDKTRGNDDRCRQSPVMALHVTEDITWTGRAGPNQARLTGAGVTLTRLRLITGPEEFAATFTISVSP